MAISFRKTPDIAAADARAEQTARNAPHVKPSAMLEFRRAHGLSQAGAAALLGYAVTWWAWREGGRVLMPPEMFAKAQAAAAVSPPRKARASRLPLAAQLATLEARVTTLEAALHRRTAAQDLI